MALNAHPRTALAAAAAMVVLVAAGCGGGSSRPSTQEVSPAGDIPDNQGFVRYDPPGGGFSVKVPEGWSRTAAGGAVTFTDKLNSIRIGAAPAAVPPTARRHVSTVSRPAGRAVLTTYLADSKADPVTGKATQDAVERYAFSHKGRNVVLTLSGPKGADNVDPWRIVTDSLRWTR